MYSRRCVVTAAAMVLAICVPAWGRQDPRQSARAVLSHASLRPGCALIVHLGCGAGELAAELARSGPHLVHALSADPAEVAAARQLLTRRKLQGRASVEHHKGGRLPYADGIVNLLIADSLWQAPGGAGAIGEIMRVLSPGGVALLAGRGGQMSAARLAAGLGKAGVKDFRLLRGGGVWARLTKPRPAGTDEWTHEKHDATRLPMSRDRVGLPTGVRWIAGPTYPRGARKGTYNSNRSVVSAGGRNFYITANDVANLTAGYNKGKLYLVARDAHNGLGLWKRLWLGDPAPTNKPILYQRGRFPLVATGEHVFTADESDLVALRAADGEVVSRCRMDSAPDAVARLDGHVLAASVGQLCSIDPATGRKKWTRPARAVDLTLGEGKAFFIDTRGGACELVCVELATGRELWKRDTAAWPGPAAPAVKGRQRRSIRFYRNGMLVCSDRGAVRGVSAADGRVGWTFPNKSNIQCDGVKLDAFFAGGLVWFPTFHGKGRKGFWGEWVGVDPAGGQVRRRLQTRRPGNACERMIATERYLIFTKYIEFFSWRGPSAGSFKGARGACSIGLMPANGLIYTHPHGCACLPYVIRGFVALESGSTGGPAAVSAPAVRLEKGPAFGRAGKAPARAGSEWPTHRHDARRSGSAAGPVGPKLALVWKKSVARRPRGPLADEWAGDQSLGDVLTAPVVAGGRVYTAVRDAHQVVALDAADGRVLWRFTAGGRIDSPPTIHEGLCLFGSKDGWVYCLAAADGRAVWRFRAAPVERRIVAFGQLESVRPVAGSVLVAHGLAYFATGRSIASDGGIEVFAVAPATGKLVWRRPVTGHDPASKLDVLTIGRGYTLLTADEKAVYLGNSAIDPATGKVTDPFSTKGDLLTGSQLGLLDGTWRRWNHPLRKDQHRWNYAARGAIILCFDRGVVFGFRHTRTTSGRGDMRISASELFGAPAGKGPATWTVKVRPPLQFEACLLAGETFFAAGPVDGHRPGRAVLWALARKDGKKLGEIELSDRPVFDGLAAAGGKLYMTSATGKVLCFGPK